jgi:hypothetical protein
LSKTPFPLGSVTKALIGCVANVLHQSPGLPSIVICAVSFVVRKIRRNNVKKALTPPVMAVRHFEFWLHRRDVLIIVVFLILNIDKVFYQYWIEGIAQD